MDLRRILCMMLILLPLASIDSPAIVIRHDRDDADHVALGKGWPAVGGLVPIGDGVVTLIDERWAITAAHVAQIISPFVRSVRFGDEDHRIARVYFHPSWGPEESLETIDMALLKLESPVRDVEPALLYRGTDEEGKVMTFVGWGDTGTGESGPTGNDGKKRAATNEAVEVLDGWVKFLFDAPPEGTPMEGISGPGDSGGPALMDVDGTPHVVGISAFNDSNGTDVGECEYGSMEFYSRVSTSVKWIEATLRGEGDEGRTWNDPTHLDQDGWPSTPAGKIARAFFKAYASGAANGLARFERRYRAEESLARKSAEERAAAWLERRSGWGDLRPSQMVIDGDRDIYVLTHVTGEDRWYNFRFRLAPRGKRKLDFIAIGWDMPPAGS